MEMFLQAIKVGIGMFLIIMIIAAGFHVFSYVCEIVWKDFFPDLRALFHRKPRRDK